MSKKLPITTTIAKSAIAARTGLPNSANSERTVRRKVVGVSTDESSWGMIKSHML